jgi:hypothetical protein
MPVPKRLRYEILRRDNHTCRYCGATAPDAQLTIDHVVPVSLGGSDEPDNLVAACKECNAGKSSSNPDQPLVADVSAENLRWRNAMHQAVAELLEDKGLREQNHERFRDYWMAWSYGGGRHADPICMPIDNHWRETINSLTAAGLPMEIIEECVDIAMSKAFLKPENIFRYMCGVAWNRVTGMQERAMEIVNGT